MKISGFLNTSLIDYPGHIVCVVFTQGCNLKCPYCHNSTLVSRDNRNKEYFPPEYIFDFLKRRKDFLDGITITGGEPTLQTDLFSFIEKIKKQSFKVKIDTNGTNWQVLDSLIKNNLIDYIAMDVKFPLEKYSAIIKENYNNNEIIRSIKNSIKIIQNSKVDYEFRTTLLPQMHNLKDINNIALLLNGSKKYFLQNFKPKNTLNKKFMKLNGFTQEKLDDFKNIFKKYISEVHIRN
ncbi:MAG: anaerobic ribonucleoside-triphosphate reductase activating protein [bacterium]